jgi:hypothetical protein
MKFTAYASETGLCRPETRDISFTQAEAAISFQRLLSEPVTWHWHVNSAQDDVLSCRTSRDVAALVLPEGRVMLAPS